MPLSHGQGHAHSTIDTVVELQWSGGLQSFNPSISLRCDKCGATYGGEKVGPEGYRHRALHWSQVDVLQREARAAGWTGPLTRESSTDKCKECSAGEPT